jgi:imidazolonepropionase-like amidohydrolase
MPLVTHYDFWRELYYVGVYGGIEPRRVLSLATQSNAEILGIDAETGTLEVGKSADLLAVEEDPLQSLRALARPALVMMRGALIREPRVDRFAQVDETVAEVEAAVR